jgi:dTDP-4-dehydrorhamnose 3,5-epimerase/CDP-3, 6-dideoxy-D-glycero-D-glycero-4-hexulose-5-epimerase
MKIKDTNIEGLFLFEGVNFMDNRGELIKPFSLNFFTDIQSHINLDIKEIWFTKSIKNVIRAMHFQVGLNACEKIVSVINGSVIDVVLDMRPQSKSFGKWYEIELNDTKGLSLYIPIGCAHGYKVLENETITMYLATDIHDAKNDTGILWNSFGYNWKIDNPILSKKDLLLTPMSEFNLETIV